MMFLDVSVMLPDESLPGFITADEETETRRDGPERGGGTSVKRYAAR